MAVSTSTHLDLILHHLDTRLLIGFARQRGLPIRSLDLGYAVHCWLRETWGEEWPKPFAIEDRGPELLVFAYHQRDDAWRQERWAQVDTTLRAIARGSLPGIKDRGPSCWQVGSTLGFQCLACPTRRLSKRGSGLPPAPRDPQQRAPGAGDEIDVWQHHLARHPDQPSHPALRDQIYTAWFAERLADDGGLELLATRVRGLQRRKLLRRTQATTRDQRQGRTVELPAVTFDGVLRITDGDAFCRTLARGVGRHRAFGFGMLLLKPA